MLRLECKQHLTHTHTHTHTLKAQSKGRDLLFKDYNKRLVELHELPPGLVTSPTL